MPNLLPVQLTSPDFFIAELIALHEVLYRLKHQLGPEVFNSRNVRLSNGDVKPVTELVALAEHLWATRMSQVLGTRRVRILGHANVHESTSLSSERVPCIFIDIIDNLHGYRHGNELWATSVLVYDPASRRIISAFLARAAELPPMLYFTTSEPGAFKLKFTNLYAPNLPVALRVAKDGTALSTARVSAHGNASTLPFSAKCSTFGISASDLSDGNLDLVLQMNEDLPHVVLGPVAIAMEAGACLGDQYSTDLDSGTFFLSLLRPGVPTGRCILATTPQLLTEVRSVIASSQ